MKATVHVGDSRQSLLKIADGSVACCVTSPPYFGLRDYGNDEQVGAEETPAEFISTLVDIFREVRRTLRDDGTLWLNLGDSYAGAGGHMSTSPMQATNRGSLHSLAPKFDRPAKNLLGIPWRVAFALQDDGWFLRSDIIWAKPNPMPESVLDRPTRSHEYVFLLTKSANYYYDAAAVAEPAVSWEGEKADPRAGAGRIAYAGKRDSGDEYLQEAFVVVNETRNRRDVWTLPPEPYKGAHFAVMPTELIKPCVLAGSQEGDLVLDPFTGSGTVGVVALRRNRDFVGVELNPDYAKMAANRIRDDGPLFNEVELCQS
jgi:DNA modification methylase